MGAWIETVLALLLHRVRLVAPYVGAWIETWVDGPTIAEVEKSHPTWVRGLKPLPSAAPPQR